MKDGGEIASFRSLLFNQVAGSLLGERPRRCKGRAKEVSKIVEETISVSQILFKAHFS